MCPRIRFLPVRLFWAIDLPPDAVEAVLAARDALAARAAAAPVRWVDPEQVHLTVKFLGDAEADGPVADAVAAGVRQGPFDLELGPVGSFGGRSLRTIWVGLGGDVAALEALADQVERACRPLGFPRERRAYHGHVTLGRVRPKRGRGGGRAALTELAAAVRAAGPPEAAPFRVDELVLYESTLEPGRPAVYTPLRRLALADRPAEEARSGAGDP